MANTERSVSTLNTNLNHQNLRDMLESLKATVGGVGNCYLNSSTNVAINTANALTNGFTLTASGEEQDFTASGNKLTYNGTATRTVKATYGMTMGMTASGNSQLAIGIQKNGSDVTASIRTSRIIQGAIEQVAVAGTCLVEMAANDYIELAMKNVTGTEDMVIQSADLTLQGTLAQ